MQFRVLLLGALAGALAACGGGGGDSGGGSPPPPPAAVDRVVLTYIGPTAAAPAGSDPAIEFTVSNPSASAAQDVRLTVTFGAGVSGGSVYCSATGEAICPANLDATNVPTLPRNSSLRFTVRRLVNAGSTGLVSVSATATAANDEVTTNNSAQLNISVYSDDVSVQAATGAGDVTGGDTVPYTITVANSGPDAALDVTLDHVFGGRQTLSSMTCAASGGATCPAAMAPTMVLPVLPNGGSLTFSIATQLGMDALGSVTTSMRAQAAGDLSFANNNSATSAYVSVPTASTSPTFTRFQSDTGDPVGRGTDYSYNRVNSVFELENYGDHFTLDITGAENWHATFYKPSGHAQWQTGLYIDAAGAPFHDPAAGGLNVRSSVGTGCDHNGWFKVTKVEYDGADLASIDIIFGQHCNNSAPALRGQIHWVANDDSRPPGPVNPPPTGLWSAPAGSTPASGNYVYLHSDAGEPIFDGTTQTFTQVNSTLGVTDTNGNLGVQVSTAVSYGGSFRAMSPLTEIEPGYYEIDPVAPFWNPAYPAMNFSGNGRSCMQAIGGWFVIDSVAHHNGEIIALDARFVQYCGSSGAALRGQIHWRSDDPSQPPGPVNPPPGGLWSPPASVPATGNVVYLETTAGNAQGPALTFTPLDSIITLGEGMGVTGNRLHFGVGGDTSWGGDFQTMSTLPDLEVGYYGDVGQYPYHDGTKGGMQVAPSSSTCFGAHGWFVIDSVTYTGNTVSAIELRFEQYCGMNTVPMHGYLRWSAADTRDPAPPQNPPPANLWQPADGKTPAGRNYVYLLAEPTGQPEQEYLYTQENAGFVLQSAWRTLEFNVNGDERWDGAFQPMLPFDELQPGYYDLPNGSNAAKGSFSWHRFDENLCGAATGWFVVDSVTYEAGVVRAIDLRFERRCVSGGPNMHGKIHWRFDDTTAAPGPVLPIPAGLWQPPAGEVPATGNVFYAKGELGNFILNNETVVSTPPTSVFQGGTGLDTYYVGAQIPFGSESWAIHFNPMNSIPRVQVGYYPNTTPNALGNPTRGRMDVAGRSLTCGQDGIGWFAVDAVSYDGDQMTSIDMRFEYRCFTGGPALRGKVRWSQ